MIIPFASSALATWPKATLYFHGFKGGDALCRSGGPNSAVDAYGNDLEDITKGWSSIIGIVTAIIGNILISIALNTQRYAHVRQAQEWEEEKEEEEEEQQRWRHSSERDTQHGEDLARTDNGNGNDNYYGNGTRDETLDYGTTKSRHEDNSSMNGKILQKHSTDTDSTRKPSSLSTPRTSPEGHNHSESEPLLSDSQRRARRKSSLDKRDNDAPSHKGPDNSNEDDKDSSRNSNSNSNTNDNSTSEETNEKNYLRSPYWWLGIVLMVLGEGGNFLAYGFAPASIVSPLGVVALISNCIIAPFMLKEPFRKRDFFGVIVAIAGAVTVVLSANNSNPKLGPTDIWHRIKTWEFETYLLVTLVIILILMVASNRYGEKSILIDLSLAGLLGGYTVLSTKGVASLLSYTLWRALTFPVTYLFIFILAASAVLQIKHVNRALQRFDSTRVIPTQFVLFTLSVILGSAILYRDFERTSGQAAAKFIGGCVLTFAGVYLLTTGDRSRSESMSESGSIRNQDDVLASEDGEDSLDSISYSKGRRGTGENQNQRPKSRSRPKVHTPFTSSLGRASFLSPYTDNNKSRSEQADGKNLRQWPPEDGNVRTSNPWHNSVNRFMGRTPSNIVNKTSGPSIVATSTATATATATATETATQSLPPPLKTAATVPILSVDNRQNVSRPVTPLAETGVSTLPEGAKKSLRRSVAGAIPAPLTSPLSSSLNVLVADSRRRGIELESPRRQRPMGPSRLAVTTYLQSRQPLSGGRAKSDKHCTDNPHTDQSSADGATSSPRD